MMHVFAVRDRATDSFDMPFFVPALGAAVRGFTDAINNKDSHLSKHPDDYDLYKLGTYDPATGMFSVDTPAQVAIGKECVNAS